MMRVNNKNPLCFYKKGQKKTKNTKKGHKMRLFSRLRGHKQEKKTQVADTPVKVKQEPLLAPQPAFFREENPELFEAVSVTLQQKYAKGFIDTQGVYHEPQEVVFQDYIGGEFLANCDRLELSAWKGSLNSLKGIEHLRNLEVFGYFGLIESNYALTYEGINPNNREMTAEEFYAIRAKLHKSRQIDDITPLYACKKLQAIELSNQHNIKEIDLSQFPELTHLDMQRCTKLTSVLGLSKLKCFEDIFTNQDFADKCQFNFCGSTLIKNVPDILSVMERFWNSDDRPNFNRPVFMFPMDSFIRFSNDDDMRYFMEAYARFLQEDKQVDPINWTENSGLMESGWNSVQAQMLKSRLDEITNTICNPNDSPFVSLYNAYQWITTNVLYDYEGIYLEDTLRNSPKYHDTYIEAMDKFHVNSQANFDKIDENMQQMKQEGKEISNEHVVGELGKTGVAMRSAYMALFNQKAVCAGLSNLLNAFATNLGLTIESCYCHLSDENDKLPFGYAPDHQISKMVVSIDKVISTVFFDPTADLGGGKMKAFGVSREGLGAQYELCALNQDVKNGKSLESWANFNNPKTWLYKNGREFYDKTRDDYYEKVRIEEEKVRKLREAKLITGTHKSFVLEEEGEVNTVEQPPIEASNSQVYPNSAQRQDKQPPAPKNTQMER